MQIKRIETREWLDGRSRGRPRAAVAVDVGRLGRGLSVALVASLPVWAALIYALTG